MDKLHYEAFYYDVYDFILELEKVDHELHKCKKETLKMLKLENKVYNDSMVGYEKRRN